MLSILWRATCPYPALDRPNFLFRPLGRQTNRGNDKKNKPKNCQEPRWSKWKSEWKWPKALYLDGTCRKRETMSGEGDDVGLFNHLYALTEFRLQHKFLEFLSYSNISVLLYYFEFGIKNAPRSATDPIQYLFIFPK